jgi:hypothetical protein
MTRRKKSVLDMGWDSAPKGRRKRGMADLIFKSKKRSRKTLGMSSMASGLASRLGGGRRRSRRTNGMASMLSNIISDRLTPTEREQIRNETEQAIQNDDQLSADRRDEGLTQRETFINRLVRVVRERFRKPVL